MLSELDGLPVYARDGVYLGTVAAIEDDWMKLNTANAPDYWLPMTVVRATVHGQVLLKSDVAEIRELSRHDPKSS